MDGSLINQSLIKGSKGTLVTGLLAVADVVLLLAGALGFLSLWTMGQLGISPHWRPFGLGTEKLCA